MENSGKEKIVSKAEEIFFSKGYKMASLQELAGALKIKPASLYYHFPGGKEEIYLAVITKRLAVYRTKIESLEAANQELGWVLTDFANWFIEQPPMNMALIAEMDMPYLTKKGKQTVMSLISSSIFTPLQSIFANARPQLKNIEPMRLVGLYMNLLNGMSFAIKKGYTSKNGLVQDYIEILLRGIIRSS